MTKGNPNDATRKLNFVPKVYDPTAKAFKPLYIAPEATSKVLGDVYLSDSVNSTDNAATGVTAATPAAVKTVQDNANNKLDKAISSSQTVTGPVTFSSLVTGSAGFKGALTGNVNGNASTATQLATARTISVKSGSQSAGSATFNGAGDITITIPKIDGTTISGVIPLASIPQGALDRVVSYISVEAAVSAWTSAGETTKPFDIGDTIRVTGVTPNVMYAVTADPSKTASYIEYAAGTATEAIHADEADHATTADTATKIGSTTIGSGVKPIYISSGTATASSSNVGSGVKPIYMASGTITASDSSVGSTTQPVYMTNGTITKIGYTIQANVPSDAKFTDTTYSDFSGATSEAAGKAGLVPAPTAGTNNRYLCSNGTWATVNAGVTGVKGNSETTYRTGNVNITPANIGAATADHTHSNYLLLSGGTLTGNLASRQIAPSTNNAYTLGTSSAQWSNVYATTFTGNLTGNASSADTATTATTAQKVNQTLTLTGDVVGSVSLNATGTRTMTASVAEGAIGYPELDDSIKVVAIQSEEPTDSNVGIWVKI